MFSVIIISNTEEMILQLLVLLVSWTFNYGFWDKLAYASMLNLVICILTEQYTHTLFINVVCISMLTLNIPWWIFVIVEYVILDDRLNDPEGKNYWGSYIVGFILFNYM
jgi:hypothetical protein